MLWMPIYLYVIITLVLLFTSLIQLTWLYAVMGGVLVWIGVGKFSQQKWNPSQILIIRSWFISLGIAGIIFGIKTFGHSSDLSFS